MEPVMRGARVRRWEGAFAMARIHVEEGPMAVALREALRALANTQTGGIDVHADLAEGAPGWRERVAALKAMII